jgi:hypothetical protein
MIAESASTGVSPVAAVCIPVVNQPSILRRAPMVQIPPIMAEAFAIPAVAPPNPLMLLFVFVNVIY